MTIRNVISRASEMVRQANQRGTQALEHNPRLHRVAEGYVKVLMAPRFTSPVPERPIATRDILPMATGLTIMQVARVAALVGICYGAEALERRFSGE